MKVGFIEAIEHVDRENTALAKTLPLGTESLKEGEGVGNGRRGGGGWCSKEPGFGMCAVLSMNNIVVSQPIYARFSQSPHLLRLVQN